MTPRLAKDWRNAPNEQGRDQLFKMYVEEKFEEFKEFEKITISRINTLVERDEKLKEITGALSKRIWVLEDNLPKKVVEIAVSKPEVKTNPLADFFSRFLKKK